MILNQQRMFNLLHDYHTIIDIRFGFFNSELKELLAIPEELTLFCKLIRSSPEGEDACKRCDKAALEHVKKYRDIYLYQCHAGLTEVIAPIIALNNDIVGYFMFGQFRVLDQDLNHWQEIQKKIERFVPSISKLKNAYLELPSVSSEKIAAGARILLALAGSVIINNYIRIQNSPMAVRVEHFILENLDKPLCLSLLSEEFGIGKTSLCTAIKNSYNLSVNKLIRKCRLDKAKELLRTSNHSISDIAEKIGMLDYNYFAKLFKKEYGVPPSRFRRLCENEYTQIAESNKDSKNITGLSSRRLDIQNLSNTVCAHSREAMSALYSRHSDTLGDLPFKD